MGNVMQYALLPVHTHVTLAAVKVQYPKFVTDTTPEVVVTNKDT